MRAGAGLTCGKDDIPGDQAMLHDGELRELDPLHPGDRLVPTAPVEFDVVRGVAVCQERDAGTWRREATSSCLPARPEGRRQRTEGTARPLPGGAGPTSWSTRRVSREPARGSERPLCHPLWTRLALQNRAGRGGGLQGADSDSGSVCTARTLHRLKSETRRDSGDREDREEADARPARGVGEGQQLDAGWN